MGRQGYVRLSVDGRPDLRKKAVSLEIGGSPIEDVLNEMLMSMAQLPSRIVVTNVTTLTAAQLDSLRCGDIVVKQTGTEQHSYSVAYKDETKGELALVYADAWNVEEVYYEKVEGAWAYIQTDTTHISS